MKWSLSDLMQWGADRMADPDWPRKMAFWTILGGAAWLLMRSRASSSKAR